jgi:hypothetical protein
LASLLIFRALYFLLPLFLAAVLLALRELLIATMPAAARRSPSAEIRDR